jgi:hypothetical protein
MDIWAKALTETVNTEAYTKASGAMLETLLTTSAPFREVQKKMTLSALEQLNMPSRADFVSLAERLTNIELLLDDMAARLNQIHQLAINAATQSAPGAQTRPEKSKSESSRVEQVTESTARKTPSKSARKRSK